MLVKSKLRLRIWAYTTVVDQVGAPVMLMKDTMSQCFSFQVEPHTGYPLKSHFQIPCLFPVRQQIFPVPIYMICDYFIDKTELADLSSLIICRARCECRSLQYGQK